MTARYRLGVDVGGTFTDAVLISETTGEVSIAKVPSTPADPSGGFLNAVDSVLSREKVSPESLAYVAHGTTVATNSLIEGKVPRTAFVTTAGFRDMLEIGRQVRPSLYDVQFEKPMPLVPRDLCFEVTERLDFAGDVLTPLDEMGVHEIAAKLVVQNVVSVAICLLHGYVNPAHERRVAEILEAHSPDISISVSSSVCPEFREYFRASTTVINACVRPVLARYLDGIERELRKRGVGAELLIMQSSGGVLTFESGASKPVYMVKSGPAAGVILSSFVAETLGKSDVISFDMGGTTAKVGLILDGRPTITKEYEVGAHAIPGRGQARGSGYPIRTPVIDLVEIGAGGGSIAWVDTGGSLRVGPQSSGAAPGPICYAKGGDQPTITDANVVLGRLDPEFFLGGEMPLDVEAAKAGIEKRCAEPLGMDVLECAHGIVEIANAEMASALRIITVQRGYDPRELTMVAFGGAGPMHANRLCQEMGIPLLVVPPSPGTASALGVLVTDLRHEYSVTRIQRRGEEHLGGINRIFSDMEAEGRGALLREGIPERDIAFRRQIETRYAGQSFEIAVDCPPGELARSTLDAIHDEFHLEHLRSYGHNSPEEMTELVNFRVTAVGKIKKPTMRAIGMATEPVATASKGTRPVCYDTLGDYVSTVIYDRGRLQAGHRLDGPAVVEEMDSSTLVLPGYVAEVDGFGNLLISLTAADTR